ncbi:peptidase S41, partial [Flavobacterium sp. LBUM151]
MKFQFVLHITLLLSTVSFAQITPSKLSNQDVRDDFEYLYKSLQATHYNLFAFQSKEKYDSLFSQLKSSLTSDSLTLLETISFYQNLVSFANTGHCEIDYPSAPYIEYAYSGGTVFPLELAFENGKVFIRKNFSANKQISIGDELLAIDKIPINEIQQLLYPFVSAERDYFKNAKIEFWSFPRLFFQLNGRKDNWNIQIKDKNNEMINLEVNSIPVIEYEGNRKGEIVDPKKTLKLY